MIWLLIFWLLMILYTIFTIIQLIHMAKRKKWGWFVVTLFFSIAALIYWLKRKMR